MRASELFGRKWQPVIIRALLQNGPMGFAELKADIEGISSKVLSENLEDLEDLRLLSREIVQTDPFRVEYSLTSSGAALEPLIGGLIDWSKEHEVLSSGGEFHE